MRLVPLVLHLHDHTDRLAVGILQSYVITESADYSDPRLQNSIIPLMDGINPVMLGYLYSHLVSAASCQMPLRVTAV